MLQHSELCIVGVSLYIYMYQTLHTVTTIYWPGCVGRHYCTFTVSNCIIIKP